MSDTYIPGFSNALQRYALGGRARAISDNSDTYAMPSAGYSTKPELAANLNALLAAKQAGQNPEMDPVEARLVAGMQQPTYSPEFQGYLTSVNDYMAGLGAPEIGRFRNTIPLNRTVAGAGSGIKAFNPEVELAQYAARPAEQNVNYYASLYGGSDKDPTGALDIGYNTPVVLVNNRTGEIVSQGVGFQAAQDIMKAAKGLTGSDGSKADWAVYAGAPGSTDTSTYKSVMSDIPDQSMLGQFADLALTGLGSALGPLGAAAGSALSSVAQGRSLGSTRGRAALAGGATYLGGKLGGVPAGGSGALGSAADISRGTLDVLRAGGAGIVSSLPNAAGSLFAALPGAASGLDTLGNALGNIVVTGAHSALPAVIGGLGALGTAGAAASGAFGGGGSSAAGGTAGTSTAPSTAPTTPAAPVEPITVTANLGGLTPAQIAAAGTLGAGGLGAIATSPNAPVSQPSSGVQQQPTQQPTTQQPATPAPAEAVDPITVIANTGGLTPAQLAAITAGATGGLGAIATSPNAPVSQPATSGNGSILDQIKNLSTLDKIRLAGLGIGTIGDLFGGNGGAAGAGTIPGGLGGLPNPVFTKALPTPTLPAATPRAAQDIDYYRYGYGPEQSFFSNVPQGAKNTSTAFTGYAEGGSAFAVGGPGDGREDKIPAMLSDGEYVMDAETVALLGNGSSKAGAQMLDKFRVNVRKQKGRKLAKGSFSDDAQAPEHYLKGRK